tara:strand:+ start:1565 stop:1873 length:309 start_codon:yes stop_codon:yes gene_type:complete
MAANEIHENDVGTKFLVTVTDGTSAVNISGASTKQLIIKKPSGAKLTKATSFVTDGTDGKMQYSIAADDLDEAGTYKLQGRVIISDGSFYTDIHTFKVYRNL